MRYINLHFIYLLTLQLLTIKTGFLAIVDNFCSSRATFQTLRRGVYKISVQEIF